MTEKNAAQAIQEGERNAAADQYFKARAWVMDTNDNRRIFEAGFDRAYALLSKLRAEGVQPGDERALTANQRKEFIRRTSYISEADRDTRAGFVDEIARAALASAPVADRQRLRELVDVVWNEATESTAVPDTPWADRLIEKVFPVRSASAPVADQREVAGVTLDGCLETLFRLGEYLGIDYAESRKQSGAPSGIYIKAIEDRVSQASNAAREEAAKLMDQTSRSSGAVLIRSLASAPVAGEANTGNHHTLKTDPEVFQAVMTGAKTFEIRLNDRGFQVGDALRLRETRFTGAEMREGKPLEYTGRECHRVVSHVLTGYGLADGWCCLSFAAPQASEAVRWVVTDDMRAAVRFAPSSAHWSERLKEFFGPDAREGINALEKQLREARADLDRQKHASEAVRTEALYLLRDARALLPMFATAEAIGDWSEKVNRFAAGDVIDIPPQADKDGGDCAKGGAEVGATSPESRASSCGTVVLPPLPKPFDTLYLEGEECPIYGAGQMQAYARAALFPTPSVVKQSLTATQTGEKGESDV